MFKGNVKKYFYSIMFVVSVFNCDSIFSMEDKFQQMRASDKWQCYFAVWQDKLSRVIELAQKNNKDLDHSDRLWRCMVLNQIDHNFSGHLGLDFLRFCKNNTAYDVIRSDAWRKYTRIDPSSVGSAIEKGDSDNFSLQEEEARDRVVSWFQAQGFSSQEAMKALIYFKKIGEHHFLKSRRQVFFN